MTMPSTPTLLRSLSLAVALSTSLGSAHVFAQPEDWEVPRTVHGQPDLQGVWANNSSTPLQRPEVFGNRATLSDEELAQLRAEAERIQSGDGDALFGDGFLNAVITGEVESYDPATGNYDQAWMVDRNLENRTSLIVDPPDGRIPDLTEEARQRMARERRQQEESPAGDYTDRPLQERCITWGMPYIMAGYNSYYQIVQSENTVAIIQEMIHDVRIIPLAERPPVDERVRLWHGDSRGYWDGDTLVVETRNFSDESRFRGSGANRVFTERYTRVGPDILEYEFTIEDPATWEEPWTAVINYTAAEGGIYEYACHEGNYALMGILSGARAEEQENDSQ